MRNYLIRLLPQFKRKAAALRILSSPINASILSLSIAGPAKKTTRFLGGIPSAHEHPQPGGPRNHRMGNRSQGYKVLCASNQLIVSVYRVLQMQGVGCADVLLYFKSPTTKQMLCPVNAYPGGRGFGGGRGAGRLYPPGNPAGFSVPALPGSAGTGRLSPATAPFGAALPNLLRNMSPSTVATFCSPLCRLSAGWPFVHDDSINSFFSVPQSVDSNPCHCRHGR